MSLVLYKDNTRTRRFASKMEKPKKNLSAPRGLKVLLTKHAGRSHGVVTVRHQGGRHKRYYRIIDFKRDKYGVQGSVEAIEYDPNRNVNIALVKYSDGEKRYILCPKDLKVGSNVVSGEKVEIKVGNAMKLKSLPIGTIVHNIEITPGKGGQIARGAGTGVLVQAKQAPVAHLIMPSGEIRMLPLEAMATVGALGNEEYKNMKLGKAGRSRHMGIRPSVRGTAMDPDSHPHGGGEARSGVGRKKPMTKYGRPAVGNTRNKKKYSARYIVKRRS